MSYLDRQYGHTHQPHSNPVVRFFMNLPWATRWILLVNLGIWFLDWLTQPQPKAFSPVSAFGIFSFEKAVHGFQFWRFVTATFLHSDFTHLLFNMMGLFFFGPVIERIFGTKRFIIFYLLCGVGSIIAYSTAIPLMEGLNISQYVLGASGSIYGVLAAFACFAPDATILFMMIIPMKARHFALLIIGIAALSSIGGVMGNEIPNLGGHVAHLGGAIIGFILVKNQSILNVISQRLGANADVITAQREPTDNYAFTPPTVSYAENMVEMTDKEQQKREKLRAKQEKAMEKIKLQEDQRRQQIDDILDKVKEHGLHSLSSKEKKLLKSETERLQNR